MRRTVAIVAAIVGLCAPPASMAADFTINDPVRAKLAERLDAAGSAANHVEPLGITQQSLNGVEAIVVTRDATIEDLSISQPQVVRETSPGTWEIHRTIFVVNHATLSLHAPRVREIRLLSSPRVFVSLIGYNGSLRFRGGLGRKLLVRSWNPRRRGADNVLRDGRASVSVRRRGRLDAFNAAFEDLGFYEGRVSGVAINTPRSRTPATGSFFRSRFARNLFGAYTYHARGVKWVGNEFVHNRVYGLDPHDDSDGFVVEGNYAAYNGRHGIIFSRDCDRNIVRRNIVEHNRWHGIVLDDGKSSDGPSNLNRVHDNVILGNRRGGISVDGSSRNTLHDNEISGSPFGVRLYRRSLHNSVRANTISDVSGTAVFVDHPSADNSVRANEIVGARTGVRVRGAPRTLITRNRIGRVTSHGVKIDGDARRRATGGTVKHNTIEGHGPSPIFVDAGAADRLELGPNAEDWNYPFAHDLARALAWVIGPSLWFMLLVVPLCGGLVFAAGQRVRRLRRRMSIEGTRDSPIRAREISGSRTNDLKVPVNQLSVRGSDGSEVEKGSGAWVQMMENLIREPGEQITCEVCGRTLLEDEKAEPLPAPSEENGQEPTDNRVCELCWELYSGLAGRE